MNSAAGEVKKNRFLITIFIMTFLVVVLMTSLQTIVLNFYIDFDEVPWYYALIMAVYCMSISALYTFITRYQIKKNLKNL